MSRRSSQARILRDIVSACESVDSRERVLDFARLPLADV